MTHRFRLAIAATALAPLFLAFGFAASAEQAFGFGAPRPLTGDLALGGGRHSNLTLAPAGGGRWIAVWESTRSLGGAIGRDADILVARSTDGGATWGAPAPLNDDAATDAKSDRAPKLATDGAGNWVAVWLADSGAKEAEASILVARSADAGATWSTPAALHVDATTLANDDRALAIARGQDGALLAAWASSNSMGGTLGGDVDLLFSRSLDGGATWSAPAALNSNAGVDAASDDQPSLATDGAGNWVAVWSAAGSYGDAHGQDRDIFAASSADNGATWSAPVLVDASALAGETLDDVAPFVATDRDGHWMAFWAEGALNSVAMATSLDGGATWSAEPLDAARASGEPSTAPTTIDSVYYNEADHGVAGPIAAFDGTGSGLAIYQHTMTRQRCTVSYGVSTCADWAPYSIGRGYRVGMSSGAVNAMTGAASKACAVAFDEEADVWIAAIQNSSGGFSAVRSLNKGATWSSSFLLTTDAAEADAGERDASPSIASDGAGAMVAAWFSREWSNGSSGENRIYLSRSVDNGETWSERAFASPNSPLSVADALYPAVATDREGTWIAAWSAKDSLGGTIGVDYDIHFIRSTDAGATWSAPGALNGNAEGQGGDNHRVALAAGDGGTWVAFWSSSNTLPGAPSEQGDRLHAARSTDDGATWSFPAEAAAYPGGGVVNDGRPAIAAGADGVWVAAFLRRADSDDFMWVRSVDDGATWSPAASFYAGQAGELGRGDSPAIATDGAGNWVAAWNSTWPNDLLGSPDLDLLYVSSADNGATWSAPRALNMGAPYDNAPAPWFERAVKLQAGPGGVWMAAWSTEELEGGQFRQFPMAARSLDGGATWSMPFELCPAVPPTLREAWMSPAIALGAAGRWIAIWEAVPDVEKYGDDLDLFYSHSDSFATAPAASASSSFATR